MRFALSRRAYYADLILVPLVALAAIALSFGWAALGVPAGFLAWTLFEYLTHRFIFHRIAWLRRGHDDHHRRPADYIGAEPGMFLLPGSMLVAPTFGWLGALWASTLLIGFLAGYLVYLLGHDAMHHSRILPGSWLHAAMRRHRAHHAAGADHDYGIVFPIWDIVFGTTNPARTKASRNAAGTRPRRPSLT